MERVGFAVADVVISTNGSLRDIAIQRGGMRPEDVFVVRNGPDDDQFTRVAPDPALKRGKPHLLAYAGLMGPQDGIEDALRALAALAARRRDWHAILMGDGEVLQDMRQLAESLGLVDVVEFPGWVPREQMRRVVSTATVCIAPDPGRP